MTDLQFTTNQWLDRLATSSESPQARFASKDGKAWLVIPGIAARSIVMNDELLDGDELQSTLTDWDGVPVTLNHPQVSGEMVSAKQVGDHLGFFGDVTLDGDKLRGNYWLDVARMVQPDAMAVFHKFSQALPVETSTGYFRTLEPVLGMHEGKSYTGIQRNIIPDHVAILPDALGACSVADGCGAMRVHASTSSATDRLITNQHDGVMVAFFLRGEDANRLNWTGHKLPAGSSALPASELHVTLAYLGKVDEVSAYTSEEQMLQALMEIAKYQTLIPAAINGIARFNSDNEEEPIVLLVDAPGLADFRRRLVDEVGWRAPVDKTHGFMPHVTLAYAPAGEVVDLPVPPREDIVFDALVLAWGGRQTVFKLQGEFREVAVNSTRVHEQACSCNKTVVNIEEKEEMAEEKEVTAVVDYRPDMEQKFLAVNAQFAEANAKLASFESFFTRFGGVDQVADLLNVAQQQAQAMAANVAREKNTLVAALVANSKCAFPAEALAAMSIEQLGFLAASLAPADYSGRGLASNRNQGTEEELFDFPMPELTTEGK